MRPFPPMLIFIFLDWVGSAKGPRILHRALKSLVLPKFDKGLPILRLQHRLFSYSLGRNLRGSGSCWTSMLIERSCCIYLSVSTIECLFTGWCKSPSIACLQLVAFLAKPRRTAFIFPASYCMPVRGGCECFSISSANSTIS